MEIRMNGTHGRLKADKKELADMAPRQWGVEGATVSSSLPEGRGCPAISARPSPA
jgi:hypothetical protein